jgi:hypothetical protein
MSTSSAAAISIANSSSHDQRDYEGPGEPESAAAISIANSSSHDQSDYEGPGEPESAADGEPEIVATVDGAKKRKEKVPPHARLWGFVRRAEDGRLRNAEVMPQDTTLWYDRNRHRFLVSFDKLIIDDLSPLEFVRFIRQLRSVSTQILFKLETSVSGVAGRARRVWS